MSLQGKVALVTGASRGIGKAIAQQLAAQGAIVVGTATTEAGAQAISAYLQAINAQGVGMALDVTQANSIDGFLAAIQSQFGAPVILVNNAGITKDGLLLRMKDDDWDAVINTNLTAIFRLSKACLKGMSKARWGRIINISSVVGQMGNAGQTNYAAAKAGLEGFTRALAKEMGGRGITANCIAPGFIETDMTHALSETQQATMLANIPANRLGQPNDIAHAVVFLASDQAAYINGVTLPVNGGMYV
ncbi:MAG: 3-oxoacyl-ACP reductase FabG [Agitococcus sp.]|jgi:3-oxoacyl-[acyl-carrier protein] reductase|nr:3-oxoacyl-ACP reductase FabG [Moraxellaceae bacterium]MBP9216334.1 3-oxoacyl-ACP reductase FabG [Agitococcus sp.]MBK7299929.1 3-oxoacyl-ACP reductase FabG [Moraxellaceae bacterium]MBK8326594.1 3-oxoacyl-ACP reductase FabG [Moraxellaceae bacterium]MBK9185937.1 3-oxoacyl-ACP reductase FabG [Moraxellaceae bacterium]